MSKHTGNGKAPEEQDHVAVKRLSLAQCDPLRLEPAENALTSILQCSHMTQHQAAVLEVSQHAEMHRHRTKESIPSALLQWQAHKFSMTSVTGGFHNESPDGTTTEKQSVMCRRWAL